MSAEALLRALSEPAAFAGLTLVVLALVVALELWNPRVRSADASRRWPAHLALAVINSVLGGQVGQWIIVGVVAAQMPVSHFLQGHFDAAPLTVLLAGVLILDFSQYLFHRLMHAPAWLWRVHGVHHSDPVFDVSTSLRFHPLEVALNIAWRLAWVLALGIPFLVLALYALLALLANALTHANVRVPAPLDRWLRTVFITPSLHRIHHSLHAVDCQRNFGTVFSLWDRLLGTYSRRSRQPRRVPGVGIAGIGADQARGLWQALCLPFAHTDSATPPTVSPRLKRSTLS